VKDLAKDYEITFWRGMKQRWTVITDIKRCQL